MVGVRSAGPDRDFYTDDDLEEQAPSANFKGVGRGIRKISGTVAADTAWGLVNGTVEGVKEVFNENLPFRRKELDRKKASSHVDIPGESRSIQQ